MVTAFRIARDPARHRAIPPRTRRGSQGGPNYCRSQANVRGSSRCPGAPLKPADMTQPLAAFQAPAPFADAVRAALASLASDAIPSRIWARDHTVWSNDPREITDRLGWLDVMREMRLRLPAIRAWADRLAGDGVEDVVLLGMGGSSL